jgi:hypothetical protein
MAKEVGRECDTHGRGMKTVQGFWFESPIEGDRSEDQKRRWEDGIRMDLRDIFLRGVGLYWIRLCQDTNRCDLF